MKEPCGEGLATHPDPESCAGHGNMAGEALTRAHAGQPWSSEITSSGVPTLYGDGEGHTEGNATRELPPGAAESETLSMRGNSVRGNREERLDDLHGRVHRGAYRAQPSKRAWIPKADGRQRPLGIDFVMGFQYRDDAERCLGELRKRFARFELEPHPGKTRLIEFGRFATENRAQRGAGKPETFNFLGFTHCCGKTRKGAFWIKRLSIAKRMRAKLQEIKQQLLTFAR